MMLTMLKAKIHRATVTNADLDYEGSITIDAAICKAANIREFEQVDVYNISSGARFTTYVILGRKGEIQVNGAAARLVQKKDKVIICAYALFSEEESKRHRPTIMLMDDRNRIPKRRRASTVPPPIS